MTPQPNQESGKQRVEEGGREGVALLERPPTVRTCSSKRAAVNSRKTAGETVDTMRHPPPVDHCPPIERSCEQRTLVSRARNSLRFIIRNHAIPNSLLTYGGHRTQPPPYLGRLFFKGIHSYLLPLFTVSRPQLTQICPPVPGLSDRFNRTSRFFPLFLSLYWTMEHVLRRSTVVNRTVQVQALRDFAIIDLSGS